MKTILRILTILLIGALVAAGIYLIVQSTTAGTDMDSAPSFDQLPATENLSQPPARLEGDFDHYSVSLTRGLSELSISLAKLAGITIIVLLVQNLAGILKKRRVFKPILG